MFSRKIIITNHAMNRFNERLRDNMYPSGYKKYKENPMKYLLNELRPLNIKEVSPMLPDGTRRAYTKNNYQVVFKEDGDKAIVLTITRANKKIRERFVK